jgi:hypothetical protein
MLPVMANSFFDLKFPALKTSLISAVSISAHLQSHRVIPGSLRWSQKLVSTRPQFLNETAFSCGGALVKKVVVVMVESDWIDAAKGRAC